MAGLSVASVHKSFRGLRAVVDVSFDVEAGSIVGLIGPNGAGKTTLFNLVAGALAPDRGEIRLGDRRISGLRSDQICRLGVGRTFQITRPFAGLTVLENVLVGALMRESSLASARKYSRQILERLDFGAKADSPAASLTLPERKRLEVARALATRPTLLLLDEVMAGLRPAETEPLIQLFRELNRESSLTILMIEHVMRAVMSLAQHIVVLHHGEILARGAPEDVVRDQTVLDVYLGSGAV